jgi:hypothetical protein
MDQLYDTEPGQPRVPLRATPEGYLIVQIAGGGGGGGSSVTNLTTTVSPTNVVVASDTGTDATIPLADVTNAGAMSPAAVTQLAGLGTASEADVGDFAAANHTHALLMTADERTKLGDLPAAAALTTSLADKMLNTLAAMQTAFNGGTAPEKAAFQASVSGYYIFPPTDDYDGIIAARDTAYNRGGGIVKLLAKTYDIGENTIEMRDGVYFEGCGFTNAPGQLAVGGTIVKGGTTGPVFAWNTSDRASPEFSNGTTFRAAAVRSAGLRDLATEGGTHGIKVGGMYSAGAAFCRFENLQCQSATQWNMYFENYIYCVFTGLKSIDAIGGHMFHAHSGNALYNCGNAEIRDWFCEGGSRTTRGIVFQSRGSGSQFNDLSVSNIQCNAYGTKISQSATMSNVSTDITVTSGAAYPRDMPVTVETTANGFEAYKTYFVVYNSGNTIRLANYMGGTAITPTGSAAASIVSYGFAPIEIVGYGAKDVNAIQSGVFTALDAEGISTSGIIGQNAQLSASTTMTFSGQGTQVANTLCLRNCRGSGTFQSAVITDLDLESSRAFWFSYLNKRTDGTTPGNAPQGFVRTSNDLQYGLSIGTRGSGSPHVSLNPVETSGQNFMYPVNPIGQRAQTSTSTNLALAGGQIGCIAYIGTVAATWTLPTLSGAALASGSYVGACFEVANASTSAVVLTLNTAASQTYNRQSAKTSVNIAQGQSLSVRAMTSGSEWWWHITGNNGVTI